MAQSFTISTKLQGMTQLREKMAKLQKANADLRAPLFACSARMERSVAENFRAQGIPDMGVSWPPISERTKQQRMKRKGRRKTGSDKALLDTGRLRNSYTRMTALGHISKIRGRSTGWQLEFGSNVEYAKKQQEGYTTQPTVQWVKPFKRKKNASKRRSRGNTVQVKGHLRMDPGGKKVPARPHLRIRPKDVQVFLRIFAEHERRAMGAA